MATDPNKTVFISYRRSVSSDLAVLIFNHLRQHGYDVFLDVRTIDNGPFDSAIRNQIGARTHFVVLIANGSLERCQHEGDWVRQEIEEALNLGRNIIPVIDECINFEQETGYLPDEWREKFKLINSLRWSHFYSDAALTALVERFQKLPKLPDENNTPYTTSLKMMPKPFDWITIPEGNVTLTKPLGYLREGTTYSVPTFEMAKYPITNAQFDRFINNPDGYEDTQWWDFSEDAQKWRTKNKQPQPRMFDGDTYPRVNVCWYEAIAFCLWLSAITGEKIMLPTEQQWQRAAQGDDGRIYPWGDRWDKSRCNNAMSVKNWRGKEIGRSKSTTPVTQYEGRGDSPFGVVDMAGNAWERCLTDYLTGKTDLLGANARIFRGCSWKHQDSDFFRTVHRERDETSYSNNDVGFRIARL